MTNRASPLSEYRALATTICSVLVSLLIFRVYLVPYTTPSWFDLWRNPQTYHFGFHNLSAAAIVVCLLAGVTWVLYSPLSSKDNDLVGLWLVTGAWLMITSATVLISRGNLIMVAREVEFLLAYVCGLIAAKTFQRIDGYITALIVCGTVQSVIAIVYQSKGIDTLVSGNVVRAGGTFGTPSDLYLIPLFILPLAVQKILSSTATVSSAFFMLCASSMLAALVLTWERSGFAAVCLGLFWLVYKHVTGKMQVVGFAIVLFLICGILFVRSNGPVNYASSMRSVHSRSYLFRAGTSVFGHHVLNGVGIGSLSLPVPVTIKGQTENVQMLQPYNQCLYWLDEMGIVGGVLMALFFTFIYRLLSKSASNLARGVAAVWISVFIAGLFNTLFGFNEFSCGNMLIGSLLGITMRLSSTVERKHEPVGELSFAHAASI